MGIIHADGRSRLAAIERIDDAKIVLEIVKVSVVMLPRFRVAIAVAQRGGGGRIGRGDDAVLSGIGEFELIVAGSIASGGELRGVSGAVIVGDRLPRRGQGIEGVIDRAETV